MNFKKPFIIMMLSIFLILTPFLPVQSLTSFEVLFQSGQAPFEEGTALSITRGEDFYLFVPTQGDAWKLPLSSLRGATATTEGVWLYWFDDEDQTTSAFFEAINVASLLANHINQSIAQYYGLPVDKMAEDQLKENYKKYEIEALKLSR